MTTVEELRCPDPPVCAETASFSESFPGPAGQQAGGLDTTTTLSS